jgi:hypothetical protein
MKMATSYEDSFSIQSNQLQDGMELYHILEEQTGKYIQVKNNLTEPIINHDMLQHWRSHWKLYR